MTLINRKNHRPFMDLSIPHALKNYIGGRFCLPQDGSFIKNYNPATGELLCYVPDSNENDLADAIKSAKLAFPAWSATSPEERCNLLNLIAFLIGEYCEDLALAETLDTGRPLRLSRTVDVPRAVANFRFFASAAMQFSSESHFRQNAEINYTLRQPLGIVGCISHWTLPIHSFTWKIAPALAAGNCVIAKPSELSPASAYLLSCICHEAGLPGGVLNIVYGSNEGCGESIVKNPDVKAVSFTGTTQIGRKVATIAAPMFKKTLLQMEGKNANIIFADCNWDKMLETTVQSSFSNQGQVCVCSSRILVERSIYNQFKSAFIEKTKELKVGNPLNAQNEMGAIISQSHFDRILKIIEIAKQEGGTILLGGKTLQLNEPFQNGLFIEPTIIEGFGSDATINTKESLGPIVTLQPFDTENEALELANDTQYGLAASIWTEDISRANRLSTKLENGIVWINCWAQQDLRAPFGGLKNSGMGREGGWEAMRFFTEAKNICMAF